jgi:hypothetical protein
VRIPFAVGAVAAFGLILGACGDLPTFLPPPDPPHLLSLDGSLHGERYEDPFLCGEATNPRVGVTCSPSAAANPAVWSCDSAGCHGVFTYEATGLGAKRSLRGAEGPSCYTCHGVEWNERTER